MTFAVAFVLLGGLLLWFVIGARGHWPTKLALIAAVTLFGFQAWRAYGSFTGYPYRHAAPADSMFVAAAIDEPHWIYLWVIARPHGAFAYKPGPVEPRAYRVKYTRQLHEQIAVAQQGSRGGRRYGLRRARGRWVAYRLRPAGLPAKTGER